jgi:hypothetical protein
MESIQIYKHKTDPTKILKIFYDEDPESPREWDNHTAKLGEILTDTIQYEDK